MSFFHSKSSSFSFNNKFSRKAHDSSSLYLVLLKLAVEFDLFNFGFCLFSKSSTLFISISFWFVTSDFILTKIILLNSEKFLSTYKLNAKWIITLMYYYKEQQ